MPTHSMPEVATREYLVAHTPDGDDVLLPFEHDSIFRDVPVNEKRVWGFEVPPSWVPGTEIVVEMPSKLRLRFYPPGDARISPGTKCGFFVPAKETVQFKGFFASSKIINATGPSASTTPRRSKSAWRFPSFQVSSAPYSALDDEDAHATGM